MIYCLSLIFAEQYKEVSEDKESISQLKDRVNYTKILLELMSFTTSISKFLSYFTTKLAIIKLTLLYKS